MTEESFLVLTPGFESRGFQPPPISVVSGYGAMVGPNEIVGFEGDTVSLQCTYREELRKNKKYWCRKSGLLIPYCSGTIYTEDGQERTKGRVSIQDNPQELTLNVTLRNLTRQDTGKYWCGVSILGFDETFLVSLVVLQGNKCLSFSGWRIGDAEGRREGRVVGCWSVVHLVSPPQRGTMPHAGGSQGRSEITEVKRLGHRPCRMSLSSSFTVAAQGHTISRWRSGVKLGSVQLQAHCLSSLFRYRREIAMGWEQGGHPTE